MKVFFGILAAVILIVLIIIAVPSSRTYAADLLSYSRCEDPTPYKIGIIDPRFNLSEEQALGHAVEAANIWSNDKGSLLFKFSSKADLTINFVYDERAALDIQIDELNKKLKDSNQALNQQKTIYEADVKAFEEKLKIFEETVDRYNKQGGAPKEVYDSLIQQQKDLQAEGDALNKRARELNLSTKNYNGDVSTLNKDINEFNSALDEKPEEGVYNSEDNTITLYFANDHDELIHTLAHEFGHSLGIEHVNDKEAIMYPYTTDALVLAEADRQELVHICREQPAILHAIEEFEWWLIKTIQNFQLSLQRG